VIIAGHYEKATVMAMTLIPNLANASVCPEDKRAPRIPSLSLRINRSASLKSISHKDVKYVRSR
jgi:hypothetical protein